MSLKKFKLTSENHFSIIVEAENIKDAANIINIYDKNENPSKVVKIEDINYISVANNTPSKKSEPLNSRISREEDKWEDEMSGARWSRGW